MLFTHTHTPIHYHSIPTQGIHALFSGEQAQLVTSKSSWMDGGMWCHLLPAAPAACLHILKQIFIPSRQRHQHLQARKGSARRATSVDSEHQHRQVRDDPAVRPDNPLPAGEDYSWAGRSAAKVGGEAGGVIFLQPIKGRSIGIL